MSVDYARLFAALCGGGVEFIVVGGRTHENVARLAAALEPFDPYLRGAPPGLPFPLGRGDDLARL